MALICPACAAKAGRSDRFCRACYTVFDSRLTSAAAAGPQSGFRGTLIAVTILAGAIFWFAQLDPEPWAYDEGSISATAAKSKRDLLGAWNRLTGDAPVAIAGAAAESAAPREAGRADDPDAADRHKDWHLPGWGGGAPAPAVTEWQLPRHAATPCPRRSECEAVLHFSSGETVRVRLRHVGYRTIAIEPLDAKGRELLELSKHAEIVEAGSMPKPVPISRAGDAVSIPDTAPTAALVSKLAGAEEVANV